MLMFSTPFHDQVLYIGHVRKMAHHACDYEPPNGGGGGGFGRPDDPPRETHIATSVREGDASHLFARPLTRTHPIHMTYEICQATQGSRSEAFVSNEDAQGK